MNDEMQIENLDELKAAYRAAMAAHDEARANLTREEEAEAELKAAHIRGNNELVAITGRRRARREDTYREYIANPAADPLGLAELSFKDALAESFLLDTVQHVVEVALPAQRLKVLQAIVDVHKIGADMSDYAVSVCELEFKKALGPAIAQQGGVVASGKLLEDLKTDTALAYRAYANAMDALRAEQARQEKMRQARAAHGMVTRAQVHSAIPQY